MSMAFGELYPAVDGNARAMLARLFDAATENRRARSRRACGDFPPRRFQSGADGSGRGGHLPRAALPECPSLALRGAQTGHTEPLAPTRRQRSTGPALIKRMVRFCCAAVRAAESCRDFGNFRAEKEKRKSSSGARTPPRHAAPGKLETVVGVIRHSITNRRIRAPVYRCVAAGDASLPARGWRWFRLSSLGRYPLSSLSLKAARLATPS
jgi:adenine-specific DNA glycosylase